MKKILTIAILCLLSGFTGHTQSIYQLVFLKEDKTGEQHSPKWLSQMNPDKLIRDYDRFYFNGEPVKSYEINKHLSGVQLADYYKYKKQYDISQGIAMGGVLTTLAGGTMIALSKTIGKGNATAGGIMAGIGATAIFAVAIPLDFHALKGLQTVGRKHNYPELYQEEKNGQRP